MNLPSRSYLTRHWPRFDPSQRTKRTKLRLLGMVTVVACCSIGYSLLYLGQRRLLYAVHDNLWLPIKGTVYTWFHPWSLIWCVFAGLLFGYCLIGFLGSRSLLRPLHLRLCHFFLGWRIAHPMMMQWTRIMLRVGIVPLMSLLVLRRKRKRLLATMWLKPAHRVSASHCKQLIALTRTGMVWTRMCYKGQESDQEEVDLWRETMMLLQSILPELPEKKLEKFSKLRSSLMMEGVEALLKLARCANLRELTERAVTAPPFSECTLAYEWLLVIADAHLARALGLQDAVEVSRKLHECLLKHGPMRRNEIMRHASVLQQQWHRGSMAEKPHDKLPEQAPAFWGRLTMDIILSFAEKQGEPAPALAWFHAVEALDLLLGMNEENNTGAFISHMLSPDDYRRLSVLAGARMQACHKQWKQSPLFTEDILKTDDFKWIQTRTTNLFDAAGPHMRPADLFKDTRHGNP